MLIWVGGNVGAFRTKLKREVESMCVCARMRMCAHKHMCMYACLEWNFVPIRVGISVFSRPSGNGKFGVRVRTNACVCVHVCGVWCVCVEWGVWLGTCSGILCSYASEGISVLSGPS